MDELFAFGVTFPKSVKIENARLAIMYYTFAAAGFAFVVQTYVTEKSYLRIATPSGRVFFWVDGPTWDVSNAEAKKLNEDFGSKDICQKPERFMYCDAPGCHTAWKDLKCMDLCTDEVVDDCIENTERWFKEDQGIFFPMYFNETVTMFASGKKTLMNKQRVLKGLEEMVLAFDHAYNVVNPEDQLQKQTDTNKNAEGDLLTVLLDKDDNEIDRWEPGKGVTLPLQTILDIAGLSMDSVKDNYGPNFLEGASFPEGILARLAGSEIDVELSYTNTMTKFTSDWNGPVCYIRINAAVAWTSKPMLDAFDHLGSHRLRYYQGLRIRFKSGGGFGAVSFGQLLNGLTSCLVFVGSAKQLTKFFAIMCLGALSRIYKRFIRQEASLERDCCGLVARMTSHTSSFMELKDTPLGITKSRLDRRFSRIFRNEEALNEAEIQRFSDFMYNKMVDQGQSIIDLERFARICSFGELLSMKSLIEIFDADRKKGLFEKLFVDHSVREIMKTDKDLRGEKGDQLSAQKLQERKTSKEHGGGLDRGNTLQRLPDAVVVNTDKEAALDGQQAGCLDQDEEEDDLLEMIQKTEAALKKHTLQLEEDHAKLKDEHAKHKDDTQEHKSQIDAHASRLDVQLNSIKEVQDSVRAMQIKLHELDEVQTINVNHQSLNFSQQEEPRQTDLDDLRAQVQALKQTEQQYLTKLEWLIPVGEEVEALKQHLDRFNSEFAKLSARLGPLEENSQGVFIEETHRRVVQESKWSNLKASPEDVEISINRQAYQDVGTAQGASQSVGSRRGEAVCGLLDICPDRKSPEVRTNFANHHGALREKEREAVQQV